MTAPEDDSGPTGCGSCGRTDEDELVEVQRIYVHLADDGTSEVTEVPGVEWWCASCRATYPHLPR